MPIEIQNYKEVNTGYKKGTCNIKMPLWGNFIIYGISIFEKEGKRWISFPSQKSEKDGVEKWFQHCRFENENMTEAFRKEFFKEFEKYQKANNPSVFDMPEKQTPNLKSSPGIPTSSGNKALNVQYDIQNIPQSKEEECPF